MGGTESNLGIGCPRVKCLVSYHSELRISRIVKIRCRCWSCVFCARLNTKRIIARVRLGSPERMITLTVARRPGETPEHAYRRCRPKIPLLLKAARSKWGALEAVSFLEFTKIGTPHWHILTTGCFIPQYWLSEVWDKLTGSPIVDIRKVKNRRHAACYVAKYVTKTCCDSRPLFKCRVVCWSRGWPKLAKWSMPDPWITFMEKRHPEAYIHYLNHTDYDILVDGSVQWHVPKDWTGTLAELPRPPPCSERHPIIQS